MSKILLFSFLTFVPLSCIIFAADEDESRQAKRSALLNTPQDLVVLNMPYDSE